MVALDDAIRDMVAGRPNVIELRRYCKEHGMVSLREDGIRKMKRGLSSLEEVLQATEDAGV
jgi:type II secretory ATPase GspE/PulE/Tfp pilus assembly ATPase PilB-like protein